MKIRVALAQINPTVGDLEGNREKIIQLLKKIKPFEVDLVAFPELAITGYPPEDLLLKKRFIEDNEIALRKLLPHTQGLTCIVGFAHLRANRLYNAAACLSDGRFIGIYHKNRLPNYGVFDEKRYFSEGDECLVFLEGDLRFGVNICEDLWVEKGPSFLEAKKGGAKLLVNISASPYEAGKWEARKKLLSRRAKEASAYLLYTNLIGGQDEIVFDGGSMIFDDRGRMLARAPQFKESTLVWDLDIPTRGKRSPKRKQADKKPPLPKQKVFSSLAREEEIYEALVLGTRDYVRKNRFQKVVLGLSGGIDSSLVACIAVDALGKDKVIGVSMSSDYSSSETEKDAKKLSKNLGIRSMELPIEHVFRGMLDLLSASFRGEKDGIAAENLQARIRGMLLMALSNKFGWLVLTTGNKSEMSTGYCTLYGDMAGGFAVIKDVPKTWVYDLVSFRNRKKAVIPKTVLTREPTAELRPNQKDSDSLPRYEDLDPILMAYVENHLSIAQMKKKGFSEKMVRDVIQKVDRNEYKRRQGPPGIKITSRAFGKDWRFPITNRYQER